MIITKEIKIFNKIIPIAELSLNSHKKILVKCDNCGKIKELKYQSYNIFTNNNTTDYNVEIRGYCDYIGNIPYNEKLSVNRVNIVKSELINVYKIPEQHIIGNGLGKIDSPKMRYRINRRCDFFFFK